MHKTHPIDQKSKEEQVGHYTLVVQTPKSLFLMDRHFMDLPQHCPQLRKPEKEKGEKKKSKGS